MTEENPTSDLSKFGYREIAEAGKLLTLYSEKKMSILAEDFFTGDGVKVFFNYNSGYVFLSDEDYNTVMDNDGVLDLWINLSYHGTEGFFEELVEQAKAGDVPEEDVQELIEAYGEYINKVDLKILEKRAGGKQ